MLGKFFLPGLILHIQVAITNDYCSKSSYLDHSPDICQGNHCGYVLKLDFPGYPIHPNEGNASMLLEYIFQHQCFLIAVQPFHKDLDFPHGHIVTSPLDPADNFLNNSSPFDRGESRLFSREVNINFFDTSYFFYVPLNGCRAVSTIHTCNRQGQP